MTMPAYKLALVLTCLVCAGQGSRASFQLDLGSENKAFESDEGSSTRMQPAPTKRSARAAALLAALLAAANPAAAYQAPGLGSPSLATGNGALSRSAVTPHARGAPILLAENDLNGDGPLASSAATAVARLRELQRLEDENIPYQKWSENENITKDMVVPLIEENKYVVLKTKDLLELKRDEYETIQALNSYAAKLDKEGVIETLWGPLSPHTWRNMPFRQAVEDGAKVLASAMPFVLADPALAFISGPNQAAGPGLSEISGPRPAPALVDAFLNQPNLVNQNEFNAVAPYLATILGLSIPASFLIQGYLQSEKAGTATTFRNPDSDGGTRFEDEKDKTWFDKLLKRLK